NLDRVHKVNLQNIISELLSNTLEISLPLFRPELAICATIVLLLLVRVFRGGEMIPPFLIALVGTLTALVMAIPEGGALGWAELPRQELFTGMLVYDSLTVFIRVFLLSFVALFIVLSRISGIAGPRDSQDYYALVLGSTLG